MTVDCPATSSAVMLLFLSQIWIRAVRPSKMSSSSVVRLLSKRSRRSRAMATWLKAFAGTVVSVGELRGSSGLRQPREPCRICWDDAAGAVPADTQGNDRGELVSVTVEHGPILIAARMASCTTCVRAQMPRGLCWRGEADTVVAGTIKTSIAMAARGPPRITVAKELQSTETLTCPKCRQRYLLLWGSPTACTERADPKSSTRIAMSR